MGKRQEVISDKINEALDQLVFERVIDSFERQEMSRKLGVLWDLPDLLSYKDLRELAIECLMMVYSVSDELSERLVPNSVPQPTEEAPPPPEEKLVFEYKPKTRTP